MIDAQSRLSEMASSIASSFHTRSGSGSNPKILSSYCICVLLQGLIGLKLQLYVLLLRPWLPRNVFSLWVSIILLGNLECLDFFNYLFLLECSKYSLKGMRFNVFEVKLVCWTHVGLGVSEGVSEYNELLELHCV